MWGVTIIIKISFLIAFVIFIKLIINVSRLIEIRLLFKGYTKWMKDYDYDFEEKTSQIIDLFKKANLENKYISITVPVIGRQYERAKTSIYDNLFLQNQIISNAIHHNFKQAIGVFKRRIYNSINPMYWIELIIYMPKHTLEFMGVDGKSRSNILQVIYWFLWIIVGVLTINEKWPLIEYIQQ